MDSRRVIDHDLPWLVESRNKIQTLMLRLLKTQADLQSEPWELWVAAAFSLWRAVFLADASSVRAGTPEIDSAAAGFLRQVIETNAITFGDDRGAHQWSAGYYINNARYRLDLDASARGRSLRELWDDTFRNLEARLSNGRLE